MVSPRPLLQAALARQETAPTARPWAAVLLSAGTPSVLAAVHPSAHRAAAPTQAIVLRSAHTHVRAEDIVDVGSQGSDPNPRAAPAPAAAWSAATEGRVDDSSHGTDPSPRPAPGSAAAAEAAHDATDEVIVGADDRMRVMATTSYPWCGTLNELLHANLRLHALHASSLMTRPACCPPCACLEPGGHIFGLGRCRISGDRWVLSLRYSSAVSPIQSALFWQVLACLACRANA